MKLLNTEEGPKLRRKRRAVGEKILRLPRFRLPHKRRTKQEIVINNNGVYENERICPERLMRLIYENPIGGASLLWLVKRKAVSRLYGMYCRTRLSAKSIPRFIEKYNVDMDGCEPTYKNFAQFFSRAKDGITFPDEPAMFGAPCEGLALTQTNISPGSVILAKSSRFGLDELFCDSELAQKYQGGTMISIRLTPANYHRMHFFDDCTITQMRDIKGHLYSVSPLALGRVVKLYCRNKRALIEMATKNFGDVVVVEVGATFVGSIVHCAKVGDVVARGEVASYFKPGGSLVLIFFTKGRITPSADIASHSERSIETRVQIGVPIGEAAGAYA